MQELDPKIAALFAAARRPADSQLFVEAVLKRLQAERRARRRWQLLLAVLAPALLVWIAPDILDATSRLFAGMNQLPLPSADFLVSPWGWALSLVFGACVLLRVLPQALGRRWMR
jgi:hypothetical protein